MQTGSDSFSIVAINVGSSSIKISIFNGKNRADININFIGLLTQTVKVKYCKGLGVEGEVYNVNVGNDLLKAASLIIDKAKEVLELLEWNAPTKIGHRVKFAGFGPTVQKITEHQEQILGFNDYLSSRHNSLCLAVIQETKKTFPKAMQFMVRDHAVDDLSLHVTGEIPFEKSIINRYGLYSNGYHGLAIKACLQELKDKYNILKFTGIICQVGSGVSVSAVVDGVVKYNTMKFAACDGPIMHNRSGTQPLGLVLRMIKYGLGSESLSSMYNRESGIYGLANLSSKSDITVEKILGDELLQPAKNAYLLSIATELFKAVSIVPGISNFVFSGGLATKHRWIGPELLYRAKVINSGANKNLIRQFENDQIFVRDKQGVNVILVDIDEQDLIRKEMNAYRDGCVMFDLSDGVCEVPGTSVGIVREGAKGWGAGNICLSFSDSVFSFNNNNLPEAFIFFGGDRDAFFIRAVFARVMKVPAFFIGDNDFDVCPIINKKILLDTPTKMAVEL
jgi:acetate kinase